VSRLRPSCGYGHMGPVMLIAASWSNRTEARPRLRSELVYRIVTVVGMLLLFAARRPIGHDPRLWETSLEVRCLVGLAAVGFAFCWWRASTSAGCGRVQSRARRIIISSTRAYSLVRHPHLHRYYIVAAAATVVPEARPLAFAGLGAGHNRMLDQGATGGTVSPHELGAEAYDAYARRTGMLFRVRR